MIKLKCRLFGHKFKEAFSFDFDDVMLSHYECAACNYVKTTVKQLSFPEIMQKLVYRGPFPEAKLPSFNYDLHSFQASLY